MNFIQFLKFTKEKNKKLFWFFLFIIFLLTENFVVQLADLNYIQLAPFSGYGMYSKKIQQPQEIIDFKITINGKKDLNLWDYTQQNKQFITDVLVYYYEMKLNNDSDPKREFFRQKLHQLNPNWEKSFEGFSNDKKDYPAFELWFKRYLSQCTGEEIKEYEVQLNHLNYRNKTEVYVRDSFSLIHYKWKN